MPYTIASSQGTQILKLEGAVTIRHVRDLAARLAEVLEDGAPLGVDTASLEDIDTGVLQLLCSLGRTVPALHFDKPSDAFLRAMDRCGLRRELLGWKESL
jgi:ABC-type transporter Mla MlaB component